MPTPKPGEKRADFVRRCIPQVIADGTAKDGAQGKAVCESMWGRKNAADQGRRVLLRAAADTAQVREVMFRGRPHLVVPVVAMVGDAVIRPVGSLGPELVPMEVLEFLPEIWNNRPVVLDHPSPAPSSANTPRVVELYSIGQTFNTAFVRGKLLTEAWIDIEQAAKVDGAPRILRHLTTAIQRTAAKGGKDEDGEDDESRYLDVSVGAYVFTERRFGSVGGKKYEYVWRGAIPDHLAVGLNGAKGACSVEAGCGMPRAAKEVTMSDQDHNPNPNPDSDPDRAPEFFRAAGTGVSDENLRQWLEAALRAVESGVKGVWVRAVYDDTVVYECFHEGERYHLYERTYEVDEGAETVTLGSEVKEVRRTVTYEPVKSVTIQPARERALSLARRVMSVFSLRPEDARLEAAVDSVLAEEGCSCPDQGQCSCSTHDGDSRPDQKEVPMSVTAKAKEAVGRLIASSATPYDESWRPHLEALTEDQLTKLEETVPKEEKAEAKETKAAEPATPPASPPAQPQTPPDGMVLVPKEEWDQVKAASAAHHAQVRAARETLVVRICESETGKGVYTPEKLAGRTLEDLQDLVRVCGVKDGTPDETPLRDYTRPLPITTAKDRQPEPAPSLYDAIRTARGVTPPAAPTTTN